MIQASKIPSDPKAPHTTSKEYLSNLKRESLTQRYSQEPHTPIKHFQAQPQYIHLAIINLTSHKMSLGLKAFYICIPKLALL